MLSDKKRILKFIEMGGWLTGLVGLSCAISARFGFAETAIIMEKFVLPGLITALIIFIFAALLVTEFIRTSRINSSFSFSGPMELFSWCPRWKKLLALTLCVVCAALLVSVGRTVHLAGQPFSLRDVIASGAIMGFFCFFTIPILASAIYMPGNYSKGPYRVLP